MKSSREETAKLSSKSLQTARHLQRIDDGDLSRFGPEIIDEMI